MRKFLQKNFFQQLLLINISSINREKFIKIKIHKKRSFKLNFGLFIFNLLSDFKIFLQS